MKDRTILGLKGLAIIGVVFHHVNNRRLDPEAVEWFKIIVLMFHWCVFAFFCVSGYLQALSDTRKQRTILEFIKNRTLRLLLPFVVLIFFYSCLWQIVQTLHIPNLAVKIPPDFIGKLASALWPVDAQVAEQLYFFPLLFGLSITLMIVQRLLGIYGLWAAALICGVFGAIYHPGTFTGFSWREFNWGIVFYAGGYLLFHYREQKTAIRVVLLAVSVFFVSFGGVFGVIHCIPLWLLAEGTTFRLDRVPLLIQLGEASGTIYIYHTPFLMAPLVIFATYLPGTIAQFIGVNLVVAIAIALCYLLFEGLKNTRAKAILM